MLQGVGWGAGYGVWDEKRDMGSEMGNGRASRSEMVSRTWGLDCEWENFGVQSGNRVWGLGCEVGGLQV